MSWPANHHRSLRAAAFVPFVGCYLAGGCALEGAKNACHFEADCVEGFTCDEQAGICRPSEVPADCVTWWRLDESDGTTAFDSCANAIHGRLVNGPAWTAGRIGGGLAFDGIDDHVDLGAPAALELAGGTFSIAAWFRVAGVGTSGSYFIGKRENHGSASWNEFAYVVGVEPGHRLRGSIASANASASSDHVDSARIIATSVWYHGVFVVDTDELRLFVDGTLEATSPRTRDPYAAGSVRLAPGADATFKLAGDLDEVLVTRRALMTTEVADLHRESKARRAK